MTGLSVLFIFCFLGLYTSKEDDHMFGARLRMLTEFLEKQLKSYEAEKRMIQVYKNYFIVLVNMF